MVNDLLDHATEEELAELWEEWKKTWTEDHKKIEKANEGWKGWIPIDSPYPEEVACDCGGEKAKTSHSHWCSTKDVK